MDSLVAWMVDLVAVLPKWWAVFILAMVPIIVLGDITGSALFFGTEQDVCTETEVKLCQTIATFLSKQIES